MSAPDSVSAPTRFPLWPLLATMAMQTLATMSAYSVPALAPAIARDLGINGALSGYFVSAVYGTGIVSSLLAAGLIHRHGAVRIGQVVLVATLAMLLVSATGSLAALAVGAVALGSAYGATAPVAAHLLVPRTPPRIMNLVLSIRQIGVPLGGVLGALVLPPVALRFGWQSGFLVIAAPTLLLILALEAPRRTWDAGEHARKAPGRGTFAPLKEMLSRSAELRRLTLACFIYSGTQLCFVAFTTVQLVSQAGFGLIEAGRGLATYQLSGVLTRPVWGWLADNVLPARWLLVIQGIVMGGAAFAAAHFGAAWPHGMVLVVCAVAGATASGYTGIAYAEFARLGGARRTEATGLGSAAQFSGVLILPSICAALVTATGNYVAAYSLVGVVAVAAALQLAGGRARRGVGAP